MAVIVALFCGVLFLMMRLVGAITGSRTIGTLAGVAVVTLPLILVAAVSLLRLVLISGGVVLVIGIPLVLFLLYRKLKSA